MYFHWDSSADCVLFKGWKIDSNVSYVFTCFALFALCMVREGILYVQKYYEISTLSGQMVPFWPTLARLKEVAALQSVRTPDERSRDERSSHLIQNKGSLFKAITVRMRLVDTALYGSSLILGYSLMLIVMTFNAGLVLVIVAGYCCGRFFFHRKTQLLQQFASVKRVRNDSDTDHCHIRT